MTLMIPSTIHSSVRSGAERRLFSVIANAPETDGWYCLHSLGLAHHETKRRAEIDFLLLTPHGLFVLEVKGGRVSRDGGQWVFTDRFAVEHRKAEGPFEQASSCMFALERHLRETFRDRPRLQNVMLGYGVMFPDVTFDATGIEADPRQIYDQRSLVRGFTSYARGLIEYTRSTQPGRRNGLGKAELEEVVTHLRGDFDLVPSFAIRAADVNDGLKRLTTRQYECLAAADSRPRLLVEGAAGTGKSLLALEMARREARESRRVLLVCFNVLLAAELKASVAEPALIPHITMNNVHGYARDLIKRAGLSEQFEEAKEKTQNDDEIFQSLAPHYAELALIELVEDPYDVLIVDEAQDILNGGMLGLFDTSLRGGLQRGRWRMFLDPNDQAAVYGKLDADAHSKLARWSVTYSLPMNCRNTREVEFATRAVARPRAMASAWQDGDSVERRWYESESGLGSALDDVLRELARNAVPPGRVSVLFPRKPPEMVARVLARHGIVELRAADVPDLGGADAKVTRWSTVSAFKGLENDLIVLAGIDRIDDDWWRAVTYVGMSRARVRLYVLIAERLKDVVEANLASLIRGALQEAAIE